MAGKVSMRLMLDLQQKPAETAADDYDRGMAAGTAWAFANVFPDGHTAPFTPECSDSQYNLGVLHGIATELYRFVVELLPSRYELMSNRPLRIVKRDGKLWLQECAPQRASILVDESAWVDVCVVPKASSSRQPCSR